MTIIKGSAPDPVVYIPPPCQFANVLRVFSPVLKLLGHHEAVELFEAIARELDAARQALDALPGESLAEAAKRTRPL